MVLTDPVPNAPVLSPQDSQIANAITAWLCSLNLIEPGLSFEAATRQCITLCRVFNLFAPQLLSERDFFIPASNAEANLSRHRRYNTRRLARCLVRHFHLTPSDPNISLPDAQSPQPLVQLRQTARDTILSLSDAARSEDVEPVPVMLSLAEVVLCAAVHSEKREPFIKAVLTLPPDHQDALAASICRTTVEKPKDTRVLEQIPVNDENLNLRNSTPSRISSALEKGASPVSTPRGIPVADYKALAAERDNLRRKLAACEFEKSKAVELSQGLKTNLEEASDKIRLLEAKQEESVTELVNKSKALSEAKTALRGAHIAAEEVDILRAKASSAEQLEASLKRASKRLEEVADMRRVNKDLEAQLTAFRETEERLSKHTEYLESQLTYSNSRSTQFAKLSESLTAEMEKKDGEIKALKGENASLKTSMEAANQQLAAFLMQSHTASRDTGINQTTEEMSASLRTLKSVGPAKISDQTSASNMEMSDELIKERTCDILFDDIGIRMTWEDIVECVDGVMDALKDLNAMDGTEDPSLGSSSEADIEPSLSISEQPRIVSQASRQSMDTNTSYIGSEAESRMSLLPDFTVMDYQERIQKGHVGDEFDYAANHTNVEEIPLGSEQQSPLPPAQCQKKIDSIPAEGTSSLSGTDDDGDCEPADETVNATIPKPFKDAGTGETGSSSCERKSSEIGTLKRSPTQPHSPFIAENIMHGKQTLHLQFGSRHIHSVRHSSLIHLRNLKRASSLTLSKRSGMSMSDSRSDTTRTLVLQTHNDLLSLQNTLDLMRTERQSSRSVGNLVHQLDITRKQLNDAQAKLLESNAECQNLRYEMDLLLKEVDVLTAQSAKKSEEETKVIEEKERMIKRLQDSLRLKEEELSISKREFKDVSEHMENLEQSRKSLEEKLRTSKVVERAQEVEIARLNAKLESNAVVAAKLDDVMKRADGLQKEISKERENHLQGIAEAVQREQRIAEEARKEARLMAKNHTTMLEDVRASALAAARGSMRANQERIPRRGAWFSDFWRRLLHLERLNSDFSTGHTSPTSFAEKDGNRVRSLRSRRQG